MKKCIYSLQNNFNNYKQSLLINPIKTEFGLIAKNVTEKIVTKILNTFNYNGWKPRSDTIN